MKNRIVYLDLLKIIACYLVIVNHVGIYIMRYSIHTPWIVFFYSLSFSFCKIAVPLFVMASGALLLSRQDTYSKMLSRIVKILVPLVGLSLLLYVYRHGFGSVLGFIPSFLQERAIVPFWYLYMLVGLYLITPFIQKMIKNFMDLDYQVFLLLFLILPSLALMVSKLTGFTLYKEFFTALFPVVIGYYVAGHYLSKVTLKSSTLWWVAAGVIVMLVFSTALMTIANLDAAEVVFPVDNIYFFNNVVMALGVFVLMKNVAVLTKLSDRIASLISQIASLTFGIYLIHAFLFSFIAESALSKAFFALSPELALLTLEIVVFMVSGLLIAGLKKIPLIRDYL